MLESLFEPREACLANLWIQSSYLKDRSLLGKDQAEFCLEFQMWCWYLLISFRSKFCSNLSSIYSLLGSQSCFIQSPIGNLWWANLGFLRSLNSHKVFELPIFRLKVSISAFLVSNFPTLSYTVDTFEDLGLQSLQNRTFSDLYQSHTTFWLSFRTQVPRKSHRNE